LLRLLLNKHSKIKKKDKQGKMGAGYDDSRRKIKKQQCKVGREEEGSSSNRPEMAAFFLALR